MSNSFGDAIMSHMVASLDPARAMQNDAMQSFVARGKAETVTVKAQTGKLLIDALETPPANAKGVAFYEALLDELKAI